MSLSKCFQFTQEKALKLFVAFITIYGFSNNSRIALLAQVSEEDKNKHGSTSAALSNLVGWAEAAQRT